MQSDWTPMLFLVIGAAILDFGLMLLVDYFLIRNMSMKYLWVVEFVIVLFLVLVKLYNNLSLYDMIFLIYYYFLVDTNALLYKATPFP